MIVDVVRYLFSQHTLHIMCIPVIVSETGADQCEATISISLCLNRTISYEVFVNIPKGHTRRRIEKSADRQNGETWLNTVLHTGITLHIFSLEGIHSVALVYSHEKCQK